MGFVFEKVDESFFPTGQAVGGGEETSYIENYRQSRDLFELKNRSDSEYNALRTKIDPIVNTVNQRLNIDLANPMTETKKDQMSIGNIWESTFDADVKEVFNIIQQNKELFPEYNNLSLDGIYKEITNDVNKLQESQIDTSRRQTTLGAVGEFAGMASAAFTDPVNFTAMAADVLFTKGAARTATSAFLGKQTLQLMLRESAIAATSESIIQKPVSDWYKKLDLPYDFNTFTTNVLSASAGAAAFTGAISAIIPGVKLTKKLYTEGIEAFDKAKAMANGVKYTKNNDVKIASDLDDVDELISSYNLDETDAGDLNHITELNDLEKTIEEKGFESLVEDTEPQLEFDFNVNAKEFDGPNSEGYKEQIALLGSEFEEEFAVKGDAFLEETVPVDVFDSATNEFIQTEVKVKDILDEMSQDKKMVERLEGCLT